MFETGFIRSQKVYICLIYSFTHANVYISHGCLLRKRVGAQCLEPIAQYINSNRQYEGEKIY